MAPARPQTSMTEYALARGKSKKQVKAEQTKELYKDITTALHTTVKDFMVDSIVDDDDDELETYQKEVNRKISELMRFQQQEADERKSVDRDLFERCEMLKRMLKEEERERGSLQRQLKESCDYVAEAIETSQRQQPRGFAELKETVLRLEESHKMMDFSIREEVRHMILEDASKRNSLDPRLEDIHRGVQERDRRHERLVEDVRSTAQKQDQQRSVMERCFEERCDQLNRHLASIERALPQPEALEESKSRWHWLEQRCDRLDAGLSQRGTAPIEALDDLRRLVQNEARERGSMSNRLEDRCDRLAAAVDSLNGALQCDAAPRSLFDEMRVMHKRLEERCDRMDASISNRQVAVSKPAEELRRLLQDEMSRRNNKERRFDERCDQIESSLLALQAAPAQLAAKNTNNINSVRDRIDNLEAILRDSKRRLSKEDNRSLPGMGGPRVNERYASLAMDLKMLRGEANTLDTSGKGTRELEAKLDAITRRILDDQAKLGKQANEQIANAIQGISRVENQLRATALDPPSRSSSHYISEEWRTMSMSTAVPSEPVLSPPQMVSPAMSPTQMASPVASPAQMPSPQLLSRSPPRGMSRERAHGVSDVVPPQTKVPQRSLSPQMAAQHMASPPMAMARGWGREEVRPPMYAGAL